MTNQINNYNLPDAFIRQAEKIGSTSTGQKSQIAIPQEGTGQSFQEILDKQLKSNQLSFSKHAATRTEQRNIEITEGDLTKLDSACAKAEEKGIRDALIVMNESAFIVNTPNKVVVTVVDKNEMSNNVFTNIDGAIFI